MGSVHPSYVQLTIAGVGAVSAPHCSDADKGIVGFVETAARARCFDQYCSV